MTTTNDSNKNNSIAESSSNNSNNTQTSSAITSKFYQKNLINHLRKCLDSLNDLVENNSIFNSSRAEEFQKEIKRLKGGFSARNDSNLLDLNVCLIGNTGSGKSSLINALLNYQIMPTAGSGEACTTFLWRISYNNTILDNSKTDDGQEGFKVEIFLKKFEEYQGEIKQAFELLSEKEDEKQEINPQILSKKNEAEKLLETLFGPRMTDNKNNKEIVFGPKRVTKSMAMSDSSIQELLKNQVHEIIQNDAKNLVKILKKYLVPKRSGRSSLPTYNSDSNDIPYWPFVKEIHVQGPFEVLRNGVILIDVPGNGDINECRSQIAKDVLDITDHIWIVSNIKRAISEENTANILSESLRDQLKMTGKYLSRTFICTHSDIITLEDSDSDETDFDELRIEKKELEEDIELIKEEIEELKGEEYDYIQEEDTQLNRTKFGPKSNNNNIKINVTTTKEKIFELERELEGKKNRSVKIDTDLKILLKQSSAFAAKQRNEKVKEDILKFELQTQQKNLNSMKRSASTRDLQVFAVSSTEHMMLKNIMRDDGRGIFQNVEDTEIPKLINHLKEISKINVSNKIDNFIKLIKALIESMLRYTDDNILLETPEKRKQAKEIFLNERKNLIHGYRDIVANIMKEFSDEIDKYILVKMGNVGKIEAENECTSIINRHGHYLHHTVWKATVRRNGCYTDSNSVTHNFNADLLRPIIKSVTNNWFVVFTETPKVLVEQLETQVNEVLTNYFKIIDKEIIKMSPDKKRYIEKFQLEIQGTKELKMNSIKENILNKIKEVQMELQNKLETAMRNSMKDAYSDAMSEPDWQSMKTYLRDHIENNKSRIFEEVINYFKEQIPLSIENIEDYIIGTVFITLNENIENDYACFWEISKQSNILLEEKNDFIMSVNEIISKLNLFQDKLNEQLSPKKEENGGERDLAKGKQKKKKKLFVL